jgi:hypothetical protein
MKEEVPFDLFPHGYRVEEQASIHVHLMPRWLPGEEGKVLRTP